MAMPVSRPQSATSVCDVRRGSAALVLLVTSALTVACSGSSDPADTSGGDVAPAATARAATTAAEAGATKRPELTPLLASVLYAPVPFEGSDGRTHLVYELGLTNFTHDTVRIEKLDVLDASSGRPVQKLGRRALNDRLQPAGLRDNVEELEASQTATLFVHVTLARRKQVPEKLTHELTFTAEAAPPQMNPLTQRLASTEVDERTLPVLSPPLTGEGVVAADACCDASRHTRAILPIDGKLFVAQRYAVDYEKIDEEGRIYVGDRGEPRNYTIYGDEALAVADGTVVATIDDLPEQTPGEFPDNIPLDEADGNSVVVDLGDGFFANYAHLQPGSVRVKDGDEVRAGDTLGTVGNSGNSVAPHLHFHVMDGPSPLAAQGLPYLIDSFTVTAQSKSTKAFDRAEAHGTALVTVPSDDGAQHTNQQVLDQRIVTFGQ